MLKRFLPTSADDGQSRRLPWGSMLMLIGGAVIVLFGGYVGDQADLRTTLPLDLRGESADGTAQRQEIGTYRIFYSHPSGPIYSRSGLESLGLQSIQGDEGPVRIRYAEEQPQVFQPWGMSVLPALAAGGLFVLGMTLVVVAHRRFRRMNSKLPRYHTS